MSAAASKEVSRRLKSAQTSRPTDLASGDCRREPWPPRKMERLEISNDSWVSQRVIEFGGGEWAVLEGYRSPLALTGLAHHFTLIASRSGRSGQSAQGLVRTSRQDCLGAQGE